MNDNLVQTPEEDPFLGDIQKFWGEVGKDLVRNSTKTIDETAKQIIAVSGILEGLYFHAIAYSDLRGQVDPGWPLIIYLAPLLLLLLSLTAALLVFFPDCYRLDIRSYRAAELIHARTVRSKYLFMRISAICLILGVAGLFAALVSYLRG